MNTSPSSAEISESAEPRPGWKQEASARLSAHRSRRGGVASQQPALPGMEPTAAPPRAARVAARVAERYARVPSYSEMLDAEAAKAALEVEPAANAARQAEQAVAEVLWSGMGAGVEAEVEEPAPEPGIGQYRVNPSSLPVARNSQAALQESWRHRGEGPDVDPHPQIVDPFEDALVAPAQTLPARVLEFPRELVAARKARPRVAEGPLRDGESQLRIFEVEPETISREPAAPAPASPEAAVSGWSSIRLDATPRNMEPETASVTTTQKPVKGAHGRAESRNAPLSSRARQSTSGKDGAKHRSALADMLPMHVASIGDRLLAATVDVALVGSAFALFVLVFMACTAHPPSGRPAMIAAAAALVGFFALYQWLFFTFGENTPGMRFAKIALCTFGDENPGRKTLQLRVGALFLAALPLGLGFLWVLLDDDRLGWHDRMTGTYQRSYRR
ncbi:MAG TPA: RDD family protein [Silvibacterium sp.]|nr:RDD family protein [Silvibacterium sp.]